MSFPLFFIFRPDGIMPPTLLHASNRMLKNSPDAFGYSSAPVLSEKEEAYEREQHRLHWLVMDKKLTMEQAVEQGYRPDNEPWGLSQVGPEN